MKITFEIIPLFAAVAAGLPTIPKSEDVTITNFYTVERSGKIEWTIFDVHSHDRVVNCTGQDTELLTKSYACSDTSYRFSLSARTTIILFHTLEDGCVHSEAPGGVLSRRLTRLQNNHERQRPCPGERSHTDLFGAGWSWYESDTFPDWGPGTDVDHHPPQALCSDLRGTSKQDDSIGG